MIFLDLFKLIILSIIQGITEILPISSSGHLILFKTILNIEYQGLDLEIILHFGSLLAVILFYRKDLITLLKSSFLYLFSKNKIQHLYEFNLLKCLIVSTLITGIVGLLLNGFIEKYLSNIMLLPFSFLLTSILIFLFSDKTENKSLNSINLKDAIFIGLFQILGLIPGVSRSGSTIIGSKILKLDYKSSIKYSYLLFIPITLSSFILKSIEFFNEPKLIYPFYYYIICIIIVFCLTLISLSFINKIIKKNTLKYFSYYLLILSLTIVLFL